VGDTSMESDGKESPRAVDSANKDEVENTEPQAPASPDSPLAVLREAAAAVFRVKENQMLLALLVFILLKLSGVSEMIQGYFEEPPLTMVGDINTAFDKDVAGATDEL
jgi:hypothetical protein